MTNLSPQDVLSAALEAGFMVSTRYGQTPPKLMPVSDSATLIEFAKLIAERCIKGEINDTTA